MDGYVENGVQQPTGPGVLVQFNEDLAQGLFPDKSHAMASIVRNLQERNRSKVDRSPNGEDCEAKSAGDGRNTSLEDVGCRNGSGLFVLGGATTVIDRRGLEDAVLTDASCAGPAELEKVVCGEPELHVSTSVDLAKETDGNNMKAMPVPKALVNGRVHTCFNGLMGTCRALAEIVCLYPSTTIAPVLVFMLLCGIGIWGVIAGASAHVQQRKDDARSRAVDAATGFQIQLQQSFTPGVTFQLLVKQQPDVGYWIKNFNATAQELMTRVPTGSLANMQLQPFAQVMMIYPQRPSDRSQVSPPRDLLADPTRKDDIMTIIRTGEPMVVGPTTLYDNSTGVFVRYPIYIPDRDANETFGFRYFDPNNTAKNNTNLRSFNDLPASVRNCNMCYNSTTREKWWGLVSVLVNYTAVASGEDAYLATLRKLGFHYALVREINSTSEQVIAQVGPTTLRNEDAVIIQVKVVNRIWLLRVSPAGGFIAPWRGPLIAAVIIIAFIISLLLFFSMASFKRQMLLLQETVAANRNLAETTKRLEEEKERMDVLLVRQYELLRCLDANRDGGKGGAPDPLASSRKAMMARIEDARRSLNVAKASLDDNVQVAEVLGAGAFGKVQKGLWRGTVVAVKTMILPANMTGQEKREKMAVMEAAISSSLVHPNIVTTYTYFIRPYHEPGLGGLHQMVAPFGSPIGGFDDRASSHGSLAESNDSTIHSYEVRLVLEYCDKGSLKDALDQHAFMQGGGLNLPAMLETAADVAKAMVHMHASNVLHSDLKARNIMLKSSGTEGRGVIAKVADFGLSTRMEHQETHLSSCFQGTLTHMAPEVMLEGRISKAADVYSFGILMWELFCGGDPFAGVPRAHIGHAITKEGRRPKFPPFAPRDYVALANSCWDPDAALRPSFEKVLTELVRLREELGGETMPLIVTPPAPITPKQSNDGMGLRQDSAIPAILVTQQLPNGGPHGGASLGRGGKSTLYGAGVILEPVSSMDSDGIPDAVEGGGDSGGASGGASGVAGAANLLLSLGPSQASTGYRTRIKTLLVQRQLRKMGIRLGTNGSSGLAQTLPALHEEMEHREG
ncbi:hypothetical protein Vretimale_16700 [Volvox reticuliferus]|uniref:Protein kinase domain-containing protein n=2 Tax=Volvox reticuliferus TaxID=1737510 RepID=A0A8J4GTP9_9CHLO|nr:hypothetical protein Vretifemale_8506 [Volvox reticuliferus]GIM13629.1 hypothetical protein Vretimale_16700 [Volvox reticuliferus]